MKAREIEYCGRMVTFHELSKISGINRKTLLNRYNLGYRGKTLTAPVRKYMTLAEKRPKKYKMPENGYSTKELYELYKGFKGKSRRECAEMLAGFMGLPLGETLAAEELIERFERYGG